MDHNAAVRYSIRRAFDLQVDAPNKWVHGDIIGLVVVRDADDQAKLDALLKFEPRLAVVGSTATRRELGWAA